MQRGQPMSATARSLSALQFVSAPSAQSLSARGSSAQSRGVNWGRFALVGLGTVVAADPEFVVLANVMGTVIFTVVPAIVAALLYAALLRFTRHAAGIFTVISA